MFGAHHRIICRHASACLSLRSRLQLWCSLCHVFLLFQWRNSSPNVSSKRLACGAHNESVNPCELRTRAKAGRFCTQRPKPQARTSPRRLDADICLTHYAGLHGRSHVRPKYTQGPPHAQIRRKVLGPTPSSRRGKGRIQAMGVLGVWPTGRAVPTIVGGDAFTLCKETVPQTISSQYHGGLRSIDPSMGTTVLRFGIITIT